MKECLEIKSEMRSHYLYIRNIFFMVSLAVFTVCFNVYSDDLMPEGKYVGKGCGILSSSNNGNWIYLFLDEHNPFISKVTVAKKKQGLFMLPKGILSDTSTTQNVGKVSVDNANKIILEIADQQYVMDKIEEPLLIAKYLKQQKKDTSFRKISESFVNVAGTYSSMIKCLREENTAIKEEKIDPDGGTCDDRVKSAKEMMKFIDECAARIDSMKKSHPAVKEIQSIDAGVLEELKSELIKVSAATSLHWPTSKDRAMIDLFYDIFKSDESIVLNDAVSGKTHIRHNANSIPHDESFYYYISQKDMYGETTLPQKGDMYKSIIFTANYPNCFQSPPSDGLCAAYCGRLNPLGYIYYEKSGSPVAIAVVGYMFSALFINSEYKGYDAMRILRGSNADDDVMQSIE